MSISLFNYLAKTTLVIATLFCMGSSVYAQQIPVGFDFSEPSDEQQIPVFTGNTLVLKTTPENPQAGDLVTVRLDGYGTNLNTATISWYLNDKLQKSGTGLRDFNFQIGTIGTTVTLKVVADIEKTGIVEATRTFSAANVVLVWEADTYTPPFYKGKALNTHGATVRVIAMPTFYDASGRLIDPSKLTYAWKKNNRAMGDVSGYGKQIFTTSESTFLRDGNNIQVEVSTADRGIVATAYALIPQSDAKIVFYENHPVQGVLYERAISGNYTLQSREFDIFAEPFFFSVPTREAKQLEYQWTLNGSPITTVGKQGRLTLRRTSGDAGISSIRVSIQNLQRILQGGKSEATVRFNRDESITNEPSPFN